MADRPITHSGENSPEQVAYKLLVAVAYAENKRLLSHNAGDTTDRKWILDAYAECLEAVQTPRVRKEASFTFKVT